MSADEERQRQDKSFVIHADAPDRPTRLVVQRWIRADSPPPAHPHADAAVTLRRRLLVVARRPRICLLRGAANRLQRAVRHAHSTRSPGKRRRRRGRLSIGPGMNDGPRYSPDGALIAFISTNGRIDIMAPRSLTIVSVRRRIASAPSRMDDAWVNEYRVGARQPIDLFAGQRRHVRLGRAHVRAAHRAGVGRRGRAERVVDGPTVDYSLSLSATAEGMAYRAVEGRTMGDVFVQDTASGRATKITDVNPELRDLALGELKPVIWRSFDGMEIWGLLLTPPGWTAGGRCR